MIDAKTEYEKRLQDYERRLREWNLAQLRQILLDLKAEFPAFDLNYDELKDFEAKSFSETKNVPAQITEIEASHPAGKLYLAYLMLPIDEAKERENLTQLIDDQTQVAVLFDDFPRKITVGEIAQAILQELPIGFHPSLAKPYSPEQQQQRDQELADKLSRRSPVAKFFDSVLQKFGF